jgi:hypothetical protein
MSEHLLKETPPLIGELTNFGVESSGCLSLRSAQVLLQRAKSFPKDGKPLPALFLCHRTSDVELRWAVSGLRYTLQRETNWSENPTLTL